MTWTIGVRPEGIDRIRMRMMKRGTEWMRVQTMDPMVIRILVIRDEMEPMDIIIRHRQATPFMALRAPTSRMEGPLGRGDAMSIPMEVLLRPGIYRMTCFRGNW